MCGLPPSLSGEERGLRSFPEQRLVIETRDKNDADKVRLFSGLLRSLGKLKVSSPEDMIRPHSMDISKQGSQSFRMEMRNTEL